MLARSWLFLPSYNGRFVDSAARAGADNVVLDLEDAVPDPLKSEARSSLIRSVEEIREKTEKKPWVRINGSDSSEFLDDLAAVTELPISGVVIPKVETVEEVAAVENFLGSEKKLVLLIESAMGVENVHQIATRTRTLAGVMFGHEDYLADIGHWSDSQTGATAYARGRVLNAAKASRISAIDTPFVLLDDNAGLEKVANNSAGDGFDGMIVLHPRQVETVNFAFSPTTRQIKEAEHLVSASEASGGAVSFSGGVFVARPLVKRAKRILDRFAGGQS